MDLSIVEDTVRIDLDIGTWIILFGGNLDLYWTFIPRCKGEEEYSFILDKEFPYIYNNISDLFNAVSENKPYKNAYFIDDKSFKEKELPIYKSSKSLELFVDDKICWKSDDFYVEDASQVIIEKAEENFIITFKKSTSKIERNTFSVRFRNSGSRYDPYNVTFMSSYRGLKEWDGQMSLF